VTSANMRAMDKPEAITAVPENTRVDVSVFCPTCGSRLKDSRCKLKCPECGFFLSCSDFY